MITISSDVSKLRALQFSQPPFYDGLNVYCNMPVLSWCRIHPHPLSGVGYIPTH